MKTIGFGLSDTGREREVNEDAFLVDERLGLFVVSDGLGGHAAGEEASRRAVEGVRRIVREGLAEVEPDAIDHPLLRRVVVEAVKTACAEIYAAASTTSELSGMASTITLLLVAGSRACMAHVGDTRLYLCREGSAWQLSSDHTMAADLVRRGEITVDEAREHRYSNVLTRVLGAQESVEPETLILDILPDDTFLLCSDGLSNYVEGPGEISTALGQDDLSAAPKELVDRANARGGSDNITAVVVGAVPGDDDEQALLTSDIRASLAALREIPALEGARFVDLLRLYNVGELRSFAPGETVLSEADWLSSLYVVIEGELELRSPAIRTRELGPGEHLGSTSLLVARQILGRVSAASSARVLVVADQEFHRLAHRQPWLGVRLLSALASELAEELPSLCADIAASGRSPRRWWNPVSWFRQPIPTRLR